MTSSWEEWLTFRCISTLSRASKQILGQCGQSLLLSSALKTSHSLILQPTLPVTCMSKWNSLFQKLFTWTKILKRSKLPFGNLQHKNGVINTLVKWPNSFSTNEKSNSRPSSSLPWPCCSPDALTSHTEAGNLDALITTWPCSTWKPNA